jgi:hypothetical protein
MHVWRKEAHLLRGNRKAKGLEQTWNVPGITWRQVCPQPSQKEEEL